MPIVPDESRTFGMEGAVPPVRHLRPRRPALRAGRLRHVASTIARPRTARLLEEGITEAGSMSSFIAAGTAYRTHGINMIPFFIYYSMFGFQRIGDLIWAACDCRAKGFLIGGTAGRTTLTGEGLQHQDGHSLLNAIGLPHRARLRPGLRLRDRDDRPRRHAADVRGGRGRDLLHHGLQRKLSPCRRCPRACDEGIIRGMYKFSTKDAGANRPHVQLFGSGAILREALRAQDILAEKYEVSSNVWSVTSYTELARDAPGRRALEHAAPDREAARSRTSKQVLAGEARAVHRRLGLRAGAGRADRALGARRAVRAGHRRLRPQRDPRGSCGGTSRSTPSAITVAALYQLVASRASSKPAASAKAITRLGHRSGKDQPGDRLSETCRRPDERAAPARRLPRHREHAVHARRRRNSTRQEPSIHGD